MLTFLRTYIYHMLISFFPFYYAEAHINGGAFPLDAHHTAVLAPELTISLVELWYFTSNSKGHGNFTRHIRGIAHDHQQQCVAAVEALD